MKTYTITTTNMRKFQVDSDSYDAVEKLANNLLEDMESILMIECHTQL